MKIHPETLVMNDAAWNTRTLADDSIVEADTGEVIVSPSAPVPELLMTRRRQLTCSCCGGDSGLFQQYHNQDTGYGICAKCVKWQLARGEDQEQINFRYGTEGVNFAKPEPDVPSL